MQNSQLPPYIEVFGDSQNIKRKDYRNVDLNGIYVLQCNLLNERIYYKKDDDKQDIYICAQYRDHSYWKIVCCKGRRCKENTCFCTGKYYQNVGKMIYPPIKKWSLNLYGRHILNYSDFEKEYLNDIILQKCDNVMIKPAAKNK